eukprot:5831457-Pleurochrysis_carterae.AAC.1
MFKKLRGTKKLKEELKGRQARRLGAPKSPHSPAQHLTARAQFKHSGIRKAKNQPRNNTNGLMANDKENYGSNDHKLA